MPRVIVIVRYEFVSCNRNFLLFLNAAILLGLFDHYMSFNYYDKITGQIKKRF